jgi:DNA (cytosine-5)-methyltransferase 1
MPSFYEFFAGGGMARAGLGDGWECLFANDIDVKKGIAYAVNWGAGRLTIKDIRAIATSELPARADLAWASFPCQDLSLAGAGGGLNGSRSGTFWPFWNQIVSLVDERRAPTLVVLENVCGALSSHQGKDFAAICDALTLAGYRFGAIVIDAAHFVPQSRPRLFLIAVDPQVVLPSGLTTGGATSLWHPSPLVAACLKLSERAKDSWIWWRLPMPAGRRHTLAEMLEDEPLDGTWNSPARTARLISMMSDVNRRKLEQAQRAGLRMVGAVYRRSRTGENGERLQRAEVRFDDVAGCLRTPAGGSSRQTILSVTGDHIRSRLLSSREAARLMGLPDSYKLPETYSDAYHLAGDGVVVPVVRFLAAHLLEPLLETRCRQDVA